ncbi:methylmalonyl Co-A mutase-associated GTPase MeaB [Halovulum dunhuangense]|uniref:Methylmalonyl Co-A mutase-associated GTPase MeaB n=1 Tax=Halovulum dunhuangense TaxID=1505036 RepID=A0A849L115_9RHOB|nr:methylmalonyl Co-A mutase-associated GTPase MeaB [Halovulum dunhuangense]NNU79954.1 methylmalonyl Co-A mutase-associated GTPase MeaB [Halovulum dunhuangense]
MDDRVETLATGVRAGERRALAKAITLIESRRPQDRPAAEALLAALGTGDGDSLRIGLTGTPGVGKSTFIEALGLQLIAAGHRVAVLAVDPSSARSGGSILGDKTRMERLSRAPEAFIRPSPAQDQLGGVARRTRETIRLVEAAGHDIVLVETVGVGQSETLVAGMTDIFVLLLAPAGGDELQGVKRGIMELADLVLVNKADGALESQARATRADYAGALRLMRPRPDDPPGYPAALTVSAATGAGLPEAWQAVERLARARSASGARARRRAEQDLSWFREELLAMLRDHVACAPRLARLGAALESDIAQGHRTPPAAAAALMRALLSGRDDPGAAAASALDDRPEAP